MEDSINYSDVCFSLEDVLEATGGILIHPCERNILFNGVLIDSRMCKPGSLFIAIKGNNFDGHIFVRDAVSSGCTGAIVCRDVSVQAPCALIKTDDTRKALGMLARFHRERFTVPVVAITGSCGKTTTKEMSARCLEYSGPVLKTPGTCNNDIGLPLTLLGLTPSYKNVVLELGINRPGETRYLTGICKPTIAVLTNIGKAHIGFFGSVYNVRKEKSSLLESLSAGASAVLPFCESGVIKLARLLNINFKTFGENSLSDFYPSDITESSEKIDFKLNGKYDVSLKLCGRHNVLNACAAAAVSSLLGIEEKVFCSSVSDMAPLPLRLKWKNIRGVNFLMDCYNSNPDAVHVAIEVFKQKECKGRRIIILGDMKELGRFSKSFHINVGRRIAKQDIDFLITVGKAAKFIAQSAKDGIPFKKIFCVDDISSTSKILSEIIKPGDCVLIKGSRTIRMERILKCFITSGN